MRHMRKADIVVIFLLLAIPLGILFASPRGALFVEIECQEGTYRYSLDDEVRLTVTGPVGETTIEISQGKARIAASDCPTKSCTRGSIDSSPETLVCLPNQVVVSISGEGGADALAY